MDSPDVPSPTAAETSALNAQTASIQALTEVAKAQLQLSQDEVDRYQEAFRDPAKANLGDLAELQSAITGKPVTAADMEGKGLEDIFRETMLQAPAELKREAENFISTTNDLSTKFNISTGLNTEKVIEDFTTAGGKFQGALSQAQAQVGKIDQDILAQEKGAASAGISSAYEEARQGLTGNLAQRGLEGSGIEAEAQSKLNIAEARDKFGASSQARVTARGITDQLRAQRLGLSEAQYNQSISQGQGIYGFNQNAAQSQFQTGAGQAGNTLNTRSSATQQGIAGLQQVQAGGQGQFIQGTNLLGQAGSSFGNSANQYGGIASNLQNQRMQKYQGDLASQNAIYGAVGSIAGQATGAAIKGF